MSATLPGGGTVDIRYGANGEPLVLLTNGRDRRYFTRSTLTGLLAMVEASGAWRLGPGLPSLDESDVRAAIAYLDEHTETTP